MIRYAPKLNLCKLHSIHACMCRRMSVIFYRLATNIRFNLRQIVMKITITVKTVLESKNVIYKVLS